MEATSSFLGLYVHRQHLIFQELVSNSSPPGTRRCPSMALLPQSRSFPRSRASALALEEVMENPTHSLASSSKDSLPKIDKSGRLITYAACLEGSDPVRLFEKRMNARREPGYKFDKILLTKYNHMTFGGPPVTAKTVEEADELMCNDDKESAIGMFCEVNTIESYFFGSSALYSASMNEPAGRILEFCILHLAMSEIIVLGTTHQIVINEAVDIAKRFCDGAAPRIINGCLRTFVTDVEENGTAQGLEGKQILFH
ncbi:antitermination NusB domain-containing protein [Actinidia rufa]|uniref:Antitermination NusB domain-containing protein n=1 Tax=Actinidia rufa TaxID=165716 RepID=A0A7J0HCN2_9ERIC|nr:antitermination NusB domain-containing protein [Actinidia rufa]